MPTHDNKNKPSVKPAAGDQPKKFRFKLLAGKHVAADPDWERPNKPGTDEPDMAVRPPSVTYSAGEVVETDTDLVQKFGADKFQLLAGGPTRTVKAGMAALLQKEVVNDHPGETLLPPADEEVQIPADVNADGGPSKAAAGTNKPSAGKDLEAEHGPLEQLTLADLKKIAREEGVDLSGAHTKAEIIEALKAGGK